jgi:hypothetical protein
VLTDGVDSSDTQLSPDHPPADYNILFQDGVNLVDHRGDMLRIKIIHAGDLVLTTGKLIACDPFSLDMGAFVTPVPLGAFPVELSLAVYPDGDRRVAAAMLRFSQARPETWYVARAADLYPEHLPEGVYYGYSVESGTGCFVDEAVVAAWAVASGWGAHEYNPEAWKYLEKWQDRLREAFADGGDISCTLDMSAIYPSNLILFGSGWGDGTYPTFIGYDAQEQLVCVVTDFRVVA